MFCISMGLIAVPSAPFAAAATNCLYSYSEVTGSPVITGATGATATLTESISDQANPTLRGTLNGKNLVVRLWKAMPEGQVRAQTAAMTQAWDSLAAASVAGATDGDSPGEVDADLPASTSLGQMETFAAAINDGSGSIDYSSYEYSTIINTTTGATGSTCLRAGSSASVTASSDTGEFKFPTATPNSLPVSTPSVIRYRTFIPTATANGLVCGTFRGDNRDFTNYFAASSRTYIGLFFKWNTQTISTAKEIGSTKRVAGPGEVGEVKTASLNGIQFYSPVMSKTYGRIQVNHSVANPLCAIAGPISYSLVFEYWKSGGTRIRGTVKTVPNHEAYSYPVNQNNGYTIYKRAVSDYMCLSLPCGNDSISATSTK